MRRRAPFLGFAAAACVGWVTTCDGFRLNADPLALGMSAQTAANSLRADLVLITAILDSEVYVVDRRTLIPGLGSVAARTFLQFRRGHLYGWTSGWRPDSVVEAE